MATDKPLRIGILSAANIAHKQLRSLSQHPEEFVVVGVASRDVSKAQAMICKWGLEGCCKAYGSYDELLADPSIQAVYIPLPSALHVPWVQKSAALGKHILLEKPISVTVADADVIVDACRNANVQLMDGTMWMHNPRAADMASLIQSSGIGKVRDIHAVFTFHGDEAWLASDVRMKADLDPLGCLGDLGWYCIRAMLWAVDWQPPVAVQAHAGAVFSADGQIPVHCGATVVFPGGVRGHMECGFDAALLQTLLVHGTEGTIRVDDFVIPRKEDTSSYQFSYNHGLRDHDTADIAAVNTKTLNLQKPQELLMWERFAECVRGIQSGKEADAHWPRVARMTQLCLNAILHSLHNGCNLEPFKWNE